MPTTIEPQSIVHKIIRLVDNSISELRSSVKQSPSATTLSTLVSDDLSTCSSVLCEQPNICYALETISQNDFVERVLMDAASGVNYIVHFYNDESSISFHVDEQLTKVLSESPSYEYVCYRINSRMAPYFTSTLRIDPDQPSTVLQFKNGQPIGRLTDISSHNCHFELRDWLKVTEKSDHFASLELRP